MPLESAQELVPVEQAIEKQVAQAKTIAAQTGATVGTMANDKPKLPKWVLPVVGVGALVIIIKALK